MREYRGKAETEEANEEDREKNKEQDIDNELEEEVEEEVEDEAEDVEREVEWMKVGECQKKLKGKNKNMPKIQRVKKTLKK